MLEIQEIDLAARQIVTTDNRRLPIADLFDGGGLKTEDAERAVICIAGGPGQWVSFRLAPFERRRLQ